MLNKNDQTVALDRALDELAQAWGSGDSGAYANLFTADAEYIAFDGSRMSGRQQIDLGHRDLFAGIMRGSTMTFEAPSIRFVRDEVAVIAVRGGIIMRWQKKRTAPSAKRMSTLGFVFVLENGAWLASAFQNTRYRPWDKTLLGRMMSKSSSK